MFLNCLDMSQYHLSVLLAFSEYERAVLCVCMTVPL